MTTHPDNHLYPTGQTYHGGPYGLPVPAAAFEARPSSGVLPPVQMISRSPTVPASPMTRQSSFGLSPGSPFQYQPPSSGAMSHFGEFRPSHAWRPMSAHEQSSTYRKDFAESSAFTSPRTSISTTGSSSYMGGSRDDPSQPPRSGVLGNPSYGYGLGLPLSEEPAAIGPFNHFTRMPVMDSPAGFVAMSRTNSMSSPDSPTDMSSDLQTTRRRANTRSSSSQEMDSKVDLKRQRNRESSQRFRDRAKEKQRIKDEQIARLEDRIRELEGLLSARSWASNDPHSQSSSEGQPSVMQLEDRNRQLEEENKQLRAQIGAPAAFYSSTFSHESSVRRTSS